MVQTCKINEPEMLVLYELFKSPAQSVKAPYWTEVSMTFWAFPPSEEAWKATLKLLLTTLQPRVYNTAETRHSQKEVLMVVPTGRLRTTPVRFERWIETFAENVGMSAGVVCFSEYFGDQMLSSMTRIAQGSKASSNPPHDKDFTLLFSTLSRQRREAERVHFMTGSEWTPENFMQIFYKNVRLTKANNEHARNMRSWNIKKLELARIINALGRTHTINAETQKEMLDMLGPVELSNDPSPEGVNVISAFAIMRRNGGEQAEPLPRPSLTEIPPYVPPTRSPPRSPPVSTVPFTLNQPYMVEMINQWEEEWFRMDFSSTAARTDEGVLEAVEVD
jgi:hypothetical protein